MVAHITNCEEYNDSIKKVYLSEANIKINSESIGELHESQSCNIASLPVRTRVIKTILNLELAAITPSSIHQKTKIIQYMGKMFDSQNVSILYIYY